MFGLLLLGGITKLLLAAVCNRGVFILRERAGGMKIVKKINNNFAVGLDSRGREVIVLGRGVGFGQVPYELTDLSRVQQTFYNVDRRYYGLLEELPESEFMLVTQLLDTVKRSVREALNPNLVFVLADHIHFAVERCRKGLYVPMPVSYELEYERPELMRLAQWMIDRVNEKFGVDLGPSEVTIVAMHLLAAMDGMKNEPDSPYSPARVAEIIRHITEIIETFFGFTIDQTSFHYFRFKNHLKFFIRRKQRGEEFSSKSEELFISTKNSYPEVYRCVQQIDDYLFSEFGSRCPHEEHLYLMIHVNQLYSKEDCYRKGITSQP